LVERESELSDVVVILRDPVGLPNEQVVQELKSCGMTVEEFDADNGAVEGTVPAGKIHDLGKLPFVQYVRRVFDYVAENDDGNPGKKGDDKEDGDLPDVDDAGA
jgi:hypothetical protein